MDMYTIYDIVYYAKLVFTLNEALHTEIKFKKTLFMFAARNS